MPSCGMDIGLEKSLVNGGGGTFATTLEKTVVDTVESGFMTKDLALLVGPEQKWLTTMGFLEKVDENLNKALAA